MSVLRPVAALYVDKRGSYANMPDVDPWDAERDARLYAGPHPVVAHPPCGPWGRLAHMCTKQDRTLSIDGVAQVLEYGGVLEHPAGSTLWQTLGLPLPGDDRDPLCFTLEVEQCRWGHKCLKRTWLLCVGVRREDLPPIPPWQEPTHVIDSSSSSKRAGTDRGRHLPKSQRHLTPPQFAAWLVAAARGSTLELYL